jgi:hypothetical protein
MATNPEYQNRTSLQEQLRLFQAAGLNLQGQTVIRDLEDAIDSKVQALHNDMSERLRVKHIRQLYSLAIPYVTPDTKAKIEDLLNDKRNEAPAPKTDIIKNPTEGAMLHVNGNPIPLDSPAHFRILLEESSEIVHSAIFDRLTMILGEVLKDLTDKGFYSRRPHGEPSKVKLELAEPKGKQ